ncbi:MAG: hypothetical protein ACK559_35165, partial [bacterium]
MIDNGHEPQGRAVVEQIGRSVGVDEAARRQFLHHGDDRTHDRPALRGARLPEAPEHAAALLPPGHRPPVPARREHGDLARRHRAARGDQQPISGADGLPAELAVAQGDERA